MDVVPISGGQRLGIVKHSCAAPPRGSVRGKTRLKWKPDENSTAPYGCQGDVFANNLGCEPGRRRLWQFDRTARPDPAEQSALTGLRRSKGPNGEGFVNVIQLTGIWRTSMIRLREKDASRERGKGVLRLITWKKYMGWFSRFKIGKGKSRSAPELDGSGEAVDELDAAAIDSPPPYAGRKRRNRDHRRGIAAGG
jgi:hypothetical protein